MNYEIKMKDFIQKVIGEKKITLFAGDEWAIHTGFKYFVMTYNQDDFKTGNITSFKYFCEKLNPITTPISEITLSILHEIGHYQNRKKHTRYNEYNEQVIQCVTDEQYYLLPEELEATQWAINFILNNPELIQKYDAQWK